MNRYLAPLALACALGMASPAAAQDRNRIPPENAQKASDIVAKIEGRPDFRYLESIEWNDQGYYEITYHTADKARVEMKIDAQTGEPRD